MFKKLWAWITGKSAAVEADVKKEVAAVVAEVKVDPIVVKVEAFIKGLLASVTTEAHTVFLALPAEIEESARAAFAKALAEVVAANPTGLPNIITLPAAVTMQVVTDEVEKVKAAIATEVARAAEVQAKIDAAVAVAYADAKSQVSDLLARVGVITMTTGNAASTADQSGVTTQAAAGDQTGGVTAPVENTATSTLVASGDTVAADTPAVVADATASIATAPLADANPALVAVADVAAAPVVAAPAVVALNLGS